MILIECRVSEVVIQVMTILMKLCVWDPFCHAEWGNHLTSEELAMLVLWGDRIELASITESDRESQEDRYEGGRIKRMR